MKESEVYNFLRKHIHEKDPTFILVTMLKEDNGCSIEAQVLDTNLQLPCKEKDATPIQVAAIKSLDKINKILDSELNLTYNNKKHTTH